MPAHTPLKISKLPEYRVVGICGEHSAFAVEIFATSSFPRALCQGKHRRIEIVLNENISLSFDIAVIPQPYNNSRVVVVTLSYI